MNIVDTAWVAGIVEGEGSIHIHKGMNKGRLAVCMTDHDVILALQQKTGVGTLVGPYKKSNFSNKDFWQWSVNKRVDLRQLLVDIFPFLFERRTMQAMICLDKLDEQDARVELRKTFCKHGHNKTETGVDSKGHCTVCRREWSRKYHEKTGR